MDQIVDQNSDQINDQTVDQSVNQSLEPIGDKTVGQPVDRSMDEKLAQSVDPFADFESDLNSIITQLAEVNKIEDKKRREDKVLIDRMPVRNNRLFENKTFDGIKSVFKFSIDCHQEYNTSKEFPKLNLPEVRVKLGIDLEEGFADCVKNNGLIDDYWDYRDKKWEYFLKAVKDNDLIAKYGPHFIAFGGPIGDILATGYNTSVDWRILAKKHKNVIYLFKTRSEGRSPASGSEARHLYCGLKFNHFITEREDPVMSEFEKYFAINTVDLDSHKLLTLNQIDAIDENGDPIEIKLVKVIQSSRDQIHFERKKLLRFWTKGAVQGITRLVIGNTNLDNYLLDIEERIVSEIPKTGSLYWSDKRCIDFLNRFLSLVKSCISDENSVFEFVFNRGRDFVACNQLPSDQIIQILPEFYTQSQD